MKFMIAATIFAASAHAAAAQSSCTVTKQQYSMLKSGASYSEAVEILGCEGEEMSSSDLAGISTIMYMWQGNSMGANMNAMFQNGRLINKAQFGLR